VILAALLAGCASGPTPPPYPAFVQVDRLPDVFLAGLPGVRAKQLAGDPESRRSSNFVTLPPDWSFGTGASPDKSLEIYVLAGRVRLGEFTLDAVHTPGHASNHLCYRHAASNWLVTGDQVIDGSVAGKLAALRDHLTSP
jgi:glyoxylase-like metal-dependent hydrolase (beta-lactamase superfamily II)